MEPFKVEILKLSNSQHSLRYESIVKGGAVVLDTLSTQLRELIRVYYPKEKLSEAQLIDRVNEHIKDVPYKEYGCWVFYPWRNTLVHILDENEFVQIRTVRNQYKLTPQEQAILKSKKIGIIGLSVGHSIAMAVAIERIAGEIRLADHDNLELTNLNRIRTSLVNLGKSKTLLLAQEIAELDPYIKVKCFFEGINENNIESFLEGDGKLDAIAEECDSVEIKYLARSTAKSKGIPVIMDTSDRGMIDVERYDLDLEYPVLHGLISKNLKYDEVKNLKTSKEKLPYILPFAGIDHITDELALSALEVDSSITTWPQLGTDVQFGGALAAKALKDVFLGRNKYSQRKYNQPSEINIDSFTSNILTINPVNITPELFPQTSEQEINEINVRTLQDIISKSIPAPSASNLQPWRFILRENDCFLQQIVIPDKYNSQETAVLFALSIGAILENIFIISLEQELSFSFEILSSPTPLLNIKLHFVRNKLNDRKDELYEYIASRQTDRRKIKGYTLTSAEIQKMKGVFTESDSGVQFHLIDNLSTISQLLDLIAESDKMRLLNENSHDFFYNSEIVIDDKETRQTGINIDHLMLDEAEKIGIQLLSRSNVRSALHDLNLGDGLLKISQSYKEYTDYIGLITLNDSSIQKFIDSGRLMQRFWLKCESIGISVHPMTSLVPFLHKNYDREVKKDETFHKIQILKSRYNHIMNSSDKPVFICRLFKAEKKEIQKSKRHSVDQILLDLGI